MELIKIAGLYERNKLAAFLLGRDGNLARLDLGSHGLGRNTIDRAAHRVAGTQDLLDGAGQVASKRLVADLAGNIDDRLEGQVAVVLNVLLLLAVARGLLQGLDDHARSRRQNLDGGGTVLHSQLDADAQASIISRRLDDVVVDLLGGDTERTDLLGEGRTSTFLTDGADVDYMMMCVVSMFGGDGWIGQY